MPSRLRVCCLVLGLWLVPEPASASELSWSGPPDCDQREQLVFQLERALSAPLSQVAAFHFQVHVERTTPDARARLHCQSRVLAPRSGYSLWAAALRDLSGLDSLTDFAALELNGNADLESLAGLRVPRTLRNVTIGAERALKDISALGPSWATPSCAPYPRSSRVLQMAFSWAPSGGSRRRMTCS